MRQPLAISIGSLALAVILGARPAASAPVVTVVMTGLDSPRGLTFALNGALFVAEAGHGGAPCTGTTGLNCYGRTGAVSRYWLGRQERIVTGLPSVSFPTGANARGPADVAIHGFVLARVTIGLEALASQRDALHRDGLGWLVRVPIWTLWALPAHLRPTDWSFDLDMAAYQETQGKESDPYSFMAVPGGYAMTDASANTLMKIDWHNDIATLAEFPSRPERGTDSVPTSVAVGPDGAYYVGELTGFGAPLPPPGDAKVYRVAPGEAPTVFCSGFNRIIDIAFDGDGSLYVLQFYPGPPPAGLGILWRVIPAPLDSPDRTCPDRVQVDTGVALDQPTAIALGPDGALYISNRGGRISVGEVLRIEP
jgi:hypothetical protein